MESSRKPANRIDVDGLRQVAPTRESLAPCQIPLAISARRRDTAALAELVVAVNAAIARLNAEAPTDRQHRRPLLLADELARYDQACRR